MTELFWNVDFEKLREFTEEEQETKYTPTVYLPKGGFEEPRRSSSMEQVVGGETRSRAALRVHGPHCPGP